MSGDIWRLFPYPTLASDGFTGGSILDVHADCASCPTRDCAKDARAKSGEVKQCRYGITYARIDEDRLVNGLVATDAVSPTSRHKRRLKAEPARRVNSNTISTAVAGAAALGPGVVIDHERSRDEMLKRLEADPEMHKALAEQLRKDFQENLNQSHDFLQLTKLVRGHAEALLNEKHPGLGTVDAAERSPTEGAIYFSTELMLLKMDSLVFLHEINRVHGGESRFQIHPFVLKYVRIYQWQADQKELGLRLEGACYAWSRYNNQAIGAVIQSLLDNLVKYAPAGSKASVAFEEGSESVLLQFVSLGPRIEPDETAKVFLPGYRARAARRVEIGGMGVGLATAKRISDAVGLSLSVQQDEQEDSRYRGRYRTTFSLALARVG